MTLGLQPIRLALCSWLEEGAPIGLELPWVVPAALAVLGGALGRGQASESLSVEFWRSCTAWGCPGGWFGRFRRLESVSSYSVFSASGVSSRSLVLCLIAYA